MFKNAIFAAALFSTVATSAFAGDITTNSNSTSGSTAAVNAVTSASSNQTSQQGNAQVIAYNNPGKVTETFKTTPGVTASPLTTTLTETCMGSYTGGVSGIGFGVTGGATVVDKACVRRLNAREVAQTLGDKEAAREIMCGDPDVNSAFAALGRPCLTTPKK